MFLLAQKVRVSKVDVVTVEVTEQLAAAVALVPMVATFAECT
jgi:hypothetical protein